MKQFTLFGKLLKTTCEAGGIMEPIERYYASMFASYYEQTDSQPSSAAVNAIAQRRHSVPRKLLKFYRDVEQPRCPVKLAEDLAALAECCFPDTVRRSALRHALEAFLQDIPAADAEDIQQILCADDLIQMWTCLTWYAICGDHHGTTSY